MNKYPREDTLALVVSNSNDANSKETPLRGSKKGKRHWIVDRRTSHRQGRDAKYWQQAPE